MEDCSDWGDYGVSETSLETSCDVPEPADYFDMNPLLDIITEYEEDDEGVTVNVNEMSEESILTAFGCSGKELEDVYLELCLDFNEAGAAVVLTLCADKGVALKKWAGSVNIDPSEILIELGFTPKKGKSLEAELRRFLKKIKRKDLIAVIDEASTDLPV